MPLRVSTTVPIKAVKKAAAGLSLTDTVTPNSIELGVEWVKQEQTEWCWAACTQMVATYLGITGIKQCELANFLHNQTTCCVNGNTGKCNQPSQFDGIGRVYDHVGIDSISERKIIFAAQLLQELKAKRPIEVGWLWQGGGGHVVLITGVFANGLYRVLDPMFGVRICNDVMLLQALGMGVWAYSFGVFKKRGN